MSKIVSNLILFVFPSTIVVCCFICNAIISALVTNTTVFLPNSNCLSGHIIKPTAFSLFQLVWHLIFCSLGPGNPDLCASLN